MPPWFFSLTATAVVLGGVAILFIARTVKRWVSRRSSSKIKIRIEDQHIEFETKSFDRTTIEAILKTVGDTPAARRPETPEAPTGIHNSSQLRFLPRSTSRAPFHADRACRALEKRGLGFIDPVPLESPQLSPPPVELASKHFNDPWLAFGDRHAGA